MTKVTFFINTLSSGGAEHQLSVLANMLCNHNYAVEVVTFGDEDDYYSLDPRISRIRLNRYPSKIMKLIQIWKFFLKVRTDWVITFGNREGFLAIPGLILNRRVKLIAGERNITMPNQPLSEFLCHKYLYRRALFVVPNSYTQGSYLKSHYPKIAGKVTVITNYTDLSKYSPKDYIIQKNRVVIIARYNPQKNWYRFAEAVYKLKEHIGETFVIDCYGDQVLKAKALSDYYAGLVSFIEKYNIGNLLRLHASIKNVAEEMNKAEAVCLPSLHEGFSNAISEAICCGRPVLCSDVADNSAMVHDGVNGFLFNPFEVDDIVISIERFLKLSDEEKHQMGIESRRIAEELFSRESFFYSYVNLLK